MLSHTVQRNMNSKFRYSFSIFTQHNLISIGQRSVIRQDTAFVIGGSEYLVTRARDQVIILVSDDPIKGVLYTMVESLIDQLLDA